MAKSRRPRKGDLVEVQNNSNLRQSVFDTEGDIGEPGLRYDVEPYQVKTVHVKLANMLLSQRAKYITKYTPTPIPKKAGDEDVWLANATGSPFYPDTVKVERIVKGERVMVDVKNPLKEPSPIRRTMHGGFDIIETEDGNDKMTWPKPHLVFDFPPFQRHPVSASYAEWNLQRDFNQVEHHQGKMRLCAEPRDYEPNDSWSLTMLQAYVECLGTQEFLPQERQHLLGRDEESYDSPDELESARSTLQKCLYFVLLDDVMAPSQADFEAYVETFVARKKARASAKNKSKSGIVPVKEARAEP